MMLSALNIFIHIILISYSASAYAFASHEGNETDRLALLHIKAKVSNDPLGILSTWNESVHFCHWLGVTCSTQHQRVIKLDLKSQKLVGSISPHMGNLSFLRMLELQNNSFTDEIPSEIGHLRRLQILYLHNNLLVGKIPANISGCSGLTRIYVAYNVLMGNIPAQLGSLSKLQSFYVTSNKLTGEYGMGSDVSAYGDVYSFGILLLEMFAGKRPTDEMFKDDLNLHEFSKLALSKPLIEIIDPILLQQEDAWETSTSNATTHNPSHIGKYKVQECLISILRIGIACSDESPSGRLEISDVVAKLHAIKATLLRASEEREEHLRIATTP